MVKLLLWRTFEASGDLEDKTRGMDPLSDECGHALGELARKVYSLVQSELENEHFGKRMIFASASQTDGKHHLYLFVAPNYNEGYRELKKKYQACFPFVRTIGINHYSPASMPIGDSETDK